MSKQIYDSRFVLSLTLAQKAHLQAQAKAQGLSISDVLRNLIIQDKIRRDRAKHSQPGQ